MHHFISKATVYTVENTQMNFLLKKKTNLLGKKKIQDTLLVPKAFIFSFKKVRYLYYYVLEGEEGYTVSTSDLSRVHLFAT